MSSLRIGALVSGAGRHAMNLHQRAETGGIPATVAVVISIGARAQAVTAMRALGLTVVEFDRANVQDDEIDAVLRSHRVNLVCLCGYLRVFRVHNWIGRVLNIHPSLLPEFGGRGMYGARVHAAVLAAARRESGCTVHLVDEKYDNGPVILQRKCRVLPGDSPKTLGDRVFAEELIAYPDAIRAWAANSSLSS
ncbi:MAG: phosphoribosylglycinamide formyltransferase [Phycisphaerales bacterium]|nr:phosphoribosylglycinamide formyltransferase [Phycisphaerales bacterium]